ncbi:MAG TPA: hypothetical protein VI461_06480 [Chitinophagaceae bacterium]|nr:hypothetical protein [Chitinophagaceae bacterium]
MQKFSLFIIAAWLCPFLCFPQGLRINVSDADEQVLFGVKQIKEKTKGKIIAPLQSVTIVSDSLKAGTLVKANNWKPVKCFGDQCYSIRFDKNRKNIYILSGETTGAMYGALDVAEAIECNSLNQLQESDNIPYIKKRGIKFNIPLDLRTPSYSDPGDAHQQNIPDVWDLHFWQTYFDEMALHRYNVMTWWSLQPFPSMVKVPEFPDVALNDIWRTKEKFDDSFSSRGLDFDRPYLFRNVELIRKITIDEKIVFWKKVMQMAADRGIDIYLFTWNKFTYGATGKHGITNRQDNDTSIAWFRASVREMIKTYPLLKGIGITAGEGMDNNRKGEYANEKWLWKTYGEGIRDGLKDQPGRAFTLIHRMHWSSLQEVQDAFKYLPCKLDLSLKYAIAHMYSIPSPPFILPAMPLLSPQVQGWLTVRNDDIYSFRWANNDYARSFIKSIPEIEKIAGFYMGPDGYCWGRDYLSKLNDNKQPPLVMQKQWYSFMLWGRLSYNPDLPDKIFLLHLPRRFRLVNTDELMKGWSAASMIFPWITRYVWGDIDLKWFPEANLSHPNHKGFYTVKDYAEREPMHGSNIEPVLSWANKKLNESGTNLLSPLDVADTLEMFSDIAFASLKKLPKAVHISATGLNQTISDIEGLAWIGKYYAEKIRAACYLALLDTTRNEQYRENSLQHLELAKKYWNSYAAIYAIKNKPALYNRVGYVDVEKLKSKVDNDLTIVRNWKAGSGQLKINGNTEVPFKQ